jgi:hypothetical protein
MAPGSGEPIEVFDRVVDRMNGPEQFDFVVQPMLPVEDEVGGEHNEEELEQDWGGLD